MIPFDEIDERLGKIGKDRVWLALQSGRKFNSIKSALAPNADETKRSALLQRVLSDVIEAEESRAKTGQEPPPAYLTVQTTVSEYRAWEDAAYSKEKKLTDWALDAIREAYKADTQPAEQPAPAFGVLLRHGEADPDGEGRGH